MKILNAVHALILFDQKILLPRKTKLRSDAGDVYLFIRVDTQLNWPRIIVEDKNKIELVWNGLSIKKMNIKIQESHPGIEIIYEEFNQDIYQSDLIPPPSAEADY